MGGTIDKLLDGVPVPKVVRVRQSFPDEHIPVDRLPQEILERVRARGAEERIRPGMRIGITAGGRGVSNILLILKTLVDLVRERGAEPFLIAAMGSHGAPPRSPRHPREPQALRHARRKNAKLRRHPSARKRLAMSFLDAVSRLILFAILLWEPRRFVWFLSSLLLFMYGWGAINNAIRPFEWETQTPADRIVSAFWGVIFILIGITMDLLKNNLQD